MAIFNINDYKSDFNDLNDEFSKKIKNKNTLAEITNSTAESKDKFLTAYNNIIDAVDKLNTSYSDTLLTTQRNIVDTLTQTINHSIYAKELNKLFESFKNNAAIVNKMCGEESEVMKLLKELERLITLYVNLNYTNCTYPADKEHLKKADEYLESYKMYEASANVIATEIENELSILNDYISKYNIQIDEWNGDTYVDSNGNTKYNKTEVYMNEIQLSDISKYIDKYLSATDSTISSVHNTNPFVVNKAIYDKNINNKAKIDNYYLLTKIFENVQDEDSTGYSTYSVFNMGFYVNEGVANREYVMDLSGKRRTNSTYFTYDALNDTYDVAEFDKNTYTAVASNSGYYQYSENVDYHFCEFTKQSSTSTYNPDKTYYSYNSATMSYMANNEPLDFLKEITKLNDWTDEIQTTFDSSRTYSYLLGKYAADKYKMRDYKKNIIAEVNQCVEKQELKTKILEIIRLLLELLEANIEDFSILPEDYELSEPDADGHCDIIADGQTKCAKSFNIKRYNKNRFYGYLGFIDKGGYVAQKANVYCAIPLKQNSKERLNKSLLINVPLLHMSNVEYSHNPKNKFWVFNIRDYAGKIRVEDEDAKEGSDGYKLDDTYIRFGNIFSSKDINLNDASSAFRLKYTSDVSWSSGTIYKKGIFEITDVSIVGKFDGELVGDKSKYTDSNFADSLDVSLKIKDISNGVVYTYKTNDDGLSLDSNFEAEHEDLASEYSGSTVTYFTGKMEIKSDEDDSDTKAIGTSAYASSKEVVLRLIQQYGSKYKIEMFLDPSSSTNDTYYEDNGKDPKVYLPMFASNFIIDNAECKHVINISRSPKLEAISALLDLANMFGGDDLDPFDADIYAKLLARFQAAQGELIQGVLDSLNAINGVAYTAVMASSVYTTNDPLYIDTYTSDIVKSFSAIQSELTSYTTTASASTTDNDYSELLDGTFATKIEGYVNDINEKIYTNMSDIMEAENMIHNYDTKLSLVSNKGRNYVDFSSTLAIFYNVVTGESQTLSTLSLGATTIFTYNLNYTYGEWSSFYEIIPNGECLSNAYFIENQTQQILYLLTQTYSLLEDTTPDYKYNSAWPKHKEFIKTLLLRLLKENITNPYYDTIFNTDVINVMRNYKTAASHIECDYLDFNSYYLNPYITQIFSQLEVFNTYNIDDFVKTDFTTQYVLRLGKAIIYKAILETSPNVINDKLTKLYNFLKQIDKLNVREALLLYSLCDVLKDIRTAYDNPSNDFNDSRYNIVYDSAYALELATYIQYIIEYKTYIESDNNPITELMACKAYDENGELLDEIKDINGNVIGVKSAGEVGTVIKKQYIDSDGKLVEEEKEITTLTLPQLLYNGSRITQNKTTVTYSGSK